MQLQPFAEGKWLEFDGKGHTNEYYIRDGRGLFNSKYICKRGAGVDINQVWYASGELSEK